MPEAVRTAHAVWSGDLLSGAGTVSATSSGLFTGLPVSWGSRTAAVDGRTSPEELLAAASLRYCRWRKSTCISPATYTL